MTLTWEIRVGDCRERMVEMPESSVDAIVTDPPYGLSFMGKGWDHDVPGVEFWAAALRVLKPGGHLLAFGGTRTFHRLTCAIEDAGFEIRDCLSWLYGSGFPKSRNLVGDWQGWGTALKPAWEPIILAQKPLIGTVAANVQAHGTGALNVDGCRIGTTVETWPASRSYHAQRGPKPRGAHGSGDGEIQDTGAVPAGRWPANVLLDEEAAAVLDEQSGDRQSGDRQSGDYGRLGFHGFGVGPMPAIVGDSGGASRFFFVSKGDECSPSDPVKNADPGSSRSSEPGDSAQSPAPIASGRTDESGHGPASIESSGSSTQPPSPVPVEPPESIGITPTTPTSCGSCGSALPVIGEPIRPGDAERAEADSDPAQGTRFLYSSKASRWDRNEGLEGVAPGITDDGRAKPIDNPFLRGETTRRNTHPTVKPTDLMRWLVRLITPPGGTVLDPFAGSGSTGIASIGEGFSFIGIEREAGYVEIARRRIGAVAPLLAQEAVS